MEIEGVADPAERSRIIELLEMQVEEQAR
jgi:hypothetical protein